MTNRELAQNLGISPAALSLIINHKPGVSDATRENVIRQLEEMGMGHLIKAKPTVVSNNLAFVIYKRHGEILDLHPFFLLLMENIEEYAGSRGYSIMLCTIDKRKDMDAQISRLNDMHCRGAIIFATEMQDDDMEVFRHLSIPYIAMDNDFPRLSCNAVSINNQMGTFQAVEHLIDMGHKRIGYLRGSIRISSFKERERGYLDALSYYGLDLREEDVITLHYTEESSYQDMRQHLKDRSEKKLSLPTAFVSDDDTIAVGALRALSEKGIHVPKDVSIIGFNDRPTCEVTIPPLTSIDVSKYTISVEVVGQLLRMVEEPEKHPLELRSRKLRIGTRLIERGSVQDIRDNSNGA